MESMKATAFSLIELLAVVAILAILAALLAPAASRVAGAYSVTRQGQLLGDQWALARQMAMSRNRDMEVRFYEASGPEGPLWTTQIWEFDPENGNATPASRCLVFPDTIVLNPTLSPLLSSLAAIPDGNGTALRVRPNGRLAGQIANTNNYVTLQLRRDDAAAPANYFTLQINPVTGAISSHRP